MSHFSRLSLLLPFLFFLAAAIQYLGFQPGNLDVDGILYLRDHFIIFMLILSLPLVYKQKWSSDRNVLRGLRSLFFLILSHLCCYSCPVIVCTFSRITLWIRTGSP
ncbi:MAG: hypothetical protein U5R06_14495 [candidate division KSB1 bacterium]|nr:hypothetical protein [candidate division KSB1 bacterium]